jgi:hypothetical protein
LLSKSSAMSDQGRYRIDIFCGRSNGFEFPPLSLEQVIATIRGTPERNASVTNKDYADPRLIQPPSAGTIVAFLEVGGLLTRTNVAA